MRRVFAVAACGFALAACTMSMPSLDFFKSAPPTETLRIESEPPGADARTTLGQNCRTPCELTVQGGEMSVTVALGGYQPQTVSLRPDQADGGTKLSPNPLYVELQALPPPTPAKKRKRVAAKKKPTTVAAQPAAGQPAPAATAAFPPPPPAAPEAASAAQYPWPTR